jgi:hypothetical protein
MLDPVEIPKGRTVARTHKGLLVTVDFRRMRWSSYLIRRAALTLARCCSTGQWALMLDRLRATTLGS